MNKLNESLLDFLLLSPRHDIFNPSLFQKGQKNPPLSLFTAFGPHYTQPINGPKKFKTSLPAPLPPLMLLFLYLPPQDT
jgi:hypothetical protein